MRRSLFMNEYFQGQVGEEKELSSLLKEVGEKQSHKKPSAKKKPTKKK